MVVLGFLGFLGLNPPQLYSRKGALLVDSEHCTEYIYHTCTCKFINCAFRHHIGRQLDMSRYVGLCRGLLGFFEVCRGLSGFVGVCQGLTRFVGVCRAWGLHYALCVCACMCVGVFVGVCRGLSGFVEVCRGLSGFVEPGGHMMPAFEIVNYTLYL